MNVKYYGVPFTPDLLRVFIKEKTDVVITKSRSERMFRLYKDIQDRPIMANSIAEKYQARDLLLLNKSGLVYPMIAPLTISNARDWMLKKIVF